MDSICTMLVLHSIPVAQWSHGCFRPMRTAPVLGVSGMLETQTSRLVRAPYRLSLPSTSTVNGGQQTARCYSHGSTYPEPHASTKASGGKAIEAGDVRFEVGHCANVCRGKCQMKLSSNCGVVGETATLLLSECVGAGRRGKRRCN